MIIHTKHQQTESLKNREWQKVEEKKKEKLLFVFSSDDKTGLIPPIKSHFSHMLLNHNLAPGGLWGGVHPQPLAAGRGNKLGRKEGRREGELADEPEEGHGVINH